MVVAERGLTSEKAQRIVEAMRASVAKRGIAGSTFEQVSREAGVSRGLLHYYFGTKERLLVEVVRQDAEIRVAMLDAPLARARTVDDVIEVLVSNVDDLLTNDPGFYVLLFELVTAGMHNEEIRRELAQLYERSRDHVAEILRRKEREGVLRLRAEAGAIVSHMFATADGLAIQRLADPGHDHRPAFEVGAQAARFLLGGD